MKFNDSFWKWFGKSQVRDDDGNPLVVYHGTNAPDFSEFKVSKGGKNETSGLGIWFSDDPDVAATFAEVEKTEYFYEDLYDDSDPGKKVALPPGVYKGPRGEQAFYRNATGEGARVIPVYLKIEHPMIFESGKAKREDSFERMMDARDKHVKYIAHSAKWRDRYIAMNTEEANEQFTKELKAEGHDGIILVNTVYDGEGDRSNQFIVFKPTQIKSALSNDGSWDAGDADIRSNPRRGR